VSDPENPSVSSLPTKALASPRSEFVQLHLWTRREDVVYLRQIAAERDQSVSAVIRAMVRAYRRSRTA
jgi:hypothetical protein